MSEFADPNIGNRELFRRTLMIAAWVFLLALIIGAMVGYRIWTMRKQNAQRESLTVRHGLITGISYQEDGSKASALIGPEVVYEGDTIFDIKVVKIHKDSVEFQKDKKTWSQRIGETPGKMWPVKEILPEEKETF